MSGSRPRILFVAPRYPYPPTRGDQRRVLHFLAGLAPRAEVTLACFGSGPPLPFDGVRVESVRHNALDAVAGNLAVLDPRLPLQVRLYLNRRMRALLARELAREPDVVHVTLARLAPYLPAGGCHRHLDLVDALSLNMRTRAAASRAPLRLALSLEGALMEAYERRLGAMADSMSLVSEADRRAVPALASAAVVPNGVDVSSFPFRDPAARPPRLVFFGNLGYFHNVEPARFVAEQVLPLVRREVPAAVLRIAGARPAAAVRRLAAHDGVELRCDVDTMVAELHDAAVAVVPMFTGSGMKNKVVEAFCAGTPVVTNALGAEGIGGAEPGRDYLVAESAAEIAAGCARLLRDAGERSRLAAAGRRLVEDEYSWERRVDDLLELYGRGRRPGAAVPAADVA